MNSREYSGNGWETPRNNCAMAQKRADWMWDVISASLVVLVVVLFLVAIGAVSYDVGKHHGYQAGRVAGIDATLLEIERQLGLAR